MKLAPVLMFVMATVFAGDGQSTPAPPGSNRIVNPRETGAVSAQNDLNADVYLTVSSVAGHPFSAQIVTTVKQVAEDGTPETYTARDLVARDAMGRWYCEHRMHPARGTYAPGGVTAQVWDPVTRTLLNLDMAHKFALVTREESANPNLDGRRTRPRPYPQREMYAGNESMLRARTLGSGRSPGSRYGERD